MFADQPIGNQAQIMQAASRAGLNLRLFRESFAGRGQLDRVELDENDAAAMGLAGTPAIFIQDVLYDGPRDTDSLIHALDAHDVTSLVGDDTRRHNARLESIDAR
ncbi:DSBA-like thioredoxin domain-containing protein [Williamsia muralis]|nr:DSBA-like thioredoxin domain-containing protein [Williamsia marianensis]